MAATDTEGLQASTPASASEATDSAAGPVAVAKTPAAVAKVPANMTQVMAGGNETVATLLDRTQAQIPKARAGKTSLRDMGAGLSTERERAGTRAEETSGDGEEEVYHPIRYSRLSFPASDLLPLGKLW